MAQMRWSTNPAVQATLVGIGAALILVAAIMSQSLEKALVNPLFQWLGKISYSLYLIHVPIIFTSIILLHDKLPLFVIVAGAGLISFPLGQLFDWTISRPAVTLGRRLSRLLWSGKPAAIAN
jgi:peptidoglycan/LPS O-acetylase OafA/YrhL